MDTCPNYQRLYSPFRTGGEKVAARKLTKGNLVFIETVGAANYGVTTPVAFADAFIVQLGLVTCPRSDLFVEGKHVDGVEHGAGSVQIHDLRRSPVSDIRDPFHVRGGLSAWQRRRALEILDAKLDGTVSLTQLAAECGLSVRHFARAFKESMGLPPHRYLLKRRIDTARGLLLGSKRSLLDIALTCGFADQSHFTRVFTASVGLSPGAMRRANEPSD